MSKTTIQSPIYKNRQTRIGESSYVLITDETGTAEVSQELAELLLSEKYDFMNFSLVGSDDIKKIEEDDLSKTEQGEDIKQPETEEKTPAELIEEETKVDVKDINIPNPEEVVINESQIEVKSESEETNNDNDEIKAIIESATDIKELREIAITLELNSTEWEGYRRHDYFKKYLFDKIDQ